MIRLWLSRMTAAVLDNGFVPSDIPQAEANALIAFFWATAGASWTTNTGWLTDTTVNNWFGVTVEGGHVTQIALNSNNLVGAAGSTLGPLAGSLTYLSCSTNSLTTLDVSALANGASYINAADNSMAEAAVDSMINDIWTRKDDWTDATPELHVGGTNAAPTGAYADDNEATGLGKVFSLVTDPDTIGFQKWSAISWNGGTAP